MVLRSVSFVLLVIGILALLNGCSLTQLWTSLSITKAEKIERHVIYDQKLGLASDIYFASRRDGVDVEWNERPTVIFVYGGGWHTGSKQGYGFVADALLEAGFDVVLPDYRLFPEAAFPEFIQDLEHFIVWYAENADHYGLSKNNVHLMGHSAGAYNIAMYLADPIYQKPFVFESFIGLAGPYDYFLPTEDPEYINIFSRNGDFNNSGSLPVKQMPSSFGNSLRRTLILHGQNDKTVTPRNIASFVAFAESQNVSVKSMTYEGVDHAKLIAVINNVPFLKSHIKKDIIAFINNKP